MIFKKRGGKQLMLKSRISLVALVVIVISVLSVFYSGVSPTTYTIGAGTSVTPTPTILPTPTGGSATPTPAPGKLIPGQIEAENYDAMSGVNTEVCSEGGRNVGWIDTGDWMDYNVNVQMTTVYKVEYRVSSPNTSGKIDLRIGASILTTTTVPNTGGWQAWTTVSTQVNLNAGIQTIRIYASGGGWNINWVKFSTVNATYILNILVQGNGTVQVSPPGTVVTNSSFAYQPGTVVILQAIPGPGVTDDLFFFSNWTGDITGSQNPATIVMESNKTITANIGYYRMPTATPSPPSFSPTPLATYSLNVSVQGRGSVQVSPPGTAVIDTGSSTIYIYRPGTLVTLKAVIPPAPTDDYIWFDSWYGNLTGNQNPVTITMDSSKAIMAKFGYTHGPTVTPTITPTSTPTPTPTPTSTPTPIPTYPPGELLSQSKPATASSFQAGNEVAKGNDGSLTTRWAASGATFPQWWKVDLGASYSLSRVDINWYSSAIRSFKYKIEVSTDNVTFTTVIDKTGNTATGDTSDSFSATGRYVRITITGASAGWASAYEFKVYGN
jgi:hypothetical protein